MDRIKLNFEETNSTTWRKVSDKIAERREFLLKKLVKNLPPEETAMIRGAIQELDLLAGIAYEESPPYE